MKRAIMLYDGRLIAGYVKETNPVIYFDLNGEEIFNVEQYKIIENVEW